MFFDYNFWRSKYEQKIKSVLINAFNTEGGLAETT